MLFFILFFVYLSIFSFILGLFPMHWEERPTFNVFGEAIMPDRKKKQQSGILKLISVINKPICQGAVRTRLQRDLAIAKIDLSPEEFFVFKEISIIVLFFVSVPPASLETKLFFTLVSVAGGYVLPEFWLKARISKIKSSLVKELPDSIDLLALCVNAGLDFMLALKWVIEKSPKTSVMEEFNNLLQEINMGKTRKEAIRDLAAKYQIADLSTFSRTLIQADKMGTSITEALNILSEDMRLSRFRRGQQVALKAPMKMLVPLLLFIFPVVAILIAGPILLDFIQNNPFKVMK